MSKYFIFPLKDEILTFKKLLNNEYDYDIDRDNELARINKLLKESYNFEIGLFSGFSGIITITSTDKIDECSFFLFVVIDTMKIHITPHVVDPSNDYFLNHIYDSKIKNEEYENWLINWRLMVSI